MKSVPLPDLMQKWCELLVKHGFIIGQDLHGKNVRSLYTWDPKKKVFKAKEGKINPDHAQMEYIEYGVINSPHDPHPREYTPTGYPLPLKRFHILYENFSLSIEEVYFWIIDHIRYDQGFTRSYKVRDVFTATENSAFFGSSQQRLGIQQDRVQQYLATIGKMVKDLFQIVRELRILDEKLQPRYDWGSAKSADITLKGEYIDLVENRGGQTSPGSVYGLAQQLGYASLPDLFFNTQVYRLQDVEKVVSKLEFNKNVKNVLQRKLYQFVNWKLKTDHELENRRTFTLKYLRQHWDVIEMYMSWIKPYLRHIARLQMNEEELQQPDLIGAFEQSFIETEVLFAKPDVKASKTLEVFLLTINFRTRPNMNFVQEGYQKGPVHVGQADIYMRAYAWSEQVIKRYMRMRREEDLYMLGVVDRSVMAAMEALGEELEQYLHEAGEPKYQKKADKEANTTMKTAKKMPGLLSGISEPFSALFSGFGDLFSFSSGSTKSAKKYKVDWYKGPGEGGKIGKGFDVNLYQTMKNFKKSHGMLSWG